ncbi:CDP-alcohol phosphatidyltransferase family protein [Candidatus Poriferisodalis sp.]|uniref:CDP-alcohol phosphatidyltransferase family protein n=1 Tax=Candidatus Poriferisodalis sp. TaxID=3101277 RepID=UPI003AF40DE0
MSGAADASLTESPGWRPFTVPNLISLARLCCLPWFVWLVFGAEDRWAAALLLGALGASDWVDGWVARRFNQVSELGKILDPTADRLLLLVALVAMIVDGSLPIWIAVLALVREGGVAVAAVVLAAAGARKIDVTWWGKTGTFLMMFAVPCFLAGVSDIAAADVFRVLAWVFVAVGLPIHYWSAFGYVPQAITAVREGRTARRSP